MITPTELSPVTLGTMQFLWTTNEKEAFRVLDTYVDLGGNIIDTADMYPNWVEGLRGGEVEAIIGRWMKQRRNRNKLFLITKVRARMWDGSDGEGLSEGHIVRAIDASLRRLQTDYVDLYLSHWSDPSTPIEETLSAYASLIHAGKVRFIGCSNYSPAELSEAMVAGKILGTEYTFLEAYYNLIDRASYEDSLQPIVDKHNLKVLPYGPLASGFLSGIYRPGRLLPNHARANFVKEKMTEKNMSVLKCLDELADKYQKSVSQVALAWLLCQNHVTSVINGADTPAQMQENFLVDVTWLTAKDQASLRSAAEGDS
jgi:aryl-alcohol dehydrogenase-like predicted oxidoreductase